MFRTTLCILALALGACSYDNGGYGGGPSGSTGNDSVTVGSASFSPITVHADSTGTVVWTWATGVTHNITFEDAIAGSGDKNSGTFSHTFANPGTYRYRCTIHSSAFGSGMHGSVVVE